MVPDTYNSNTWEVEADKNERKRYILIKLEAKRYH
jgi:hypothetical protein